MIGLGDVSSALGSVSTALGGGAAAPAATNEPKYLRGQHIDQEDAQTGGATAPNLVNDRDTHPQIEFIHFGNVHTSYGNLFPHDSYKDNEAIDSLPDKARPRAIQFRSALEREAVLLSVFIEATQTILAERESMGSLGGLVSAAGSLLGGTGGGAGGNAKSSDLDASLQKVIAAAGTLNAATIQYHDTHKAGMDFHQARTDYRAILAKVVGEPPKQDPTSGLLGALPGTGSIAGPVGGLISMTQGIVFKASDIKIKIHVLVAAQQERQIELACHDLSLLSINGGVNPFLPVWCPTPDKMATQNQAADATQAAADKKNLADVFNSAAGNPLGLSNPSATSTTDTQGQQKGFFDVQAPSDTPAGTPFIDQAFEVPKPSAVATDPVPMEMGKLTCQAFITALGQSSPLPSIVDSILTKVDGFASDFVTAIYETLLIRSGDQVITQAALVKGALEKLDLVGKFEAMTLDKLSFLQAAKNANLSAAGYSLAPGGLADDANTKLKDLIDDRITPIMNKAVDTAMAELSTQLELARQDSASTKSYTMEWYLGRLPWVRTSLFFNLFFPFWTALMRCVVDAVGGPAGAALKAIVDAADKLKGAADSVKSVVDKAQNVQQNIGQGVNFLDPSQLTNLDKGQAGGPAAATQGLAPSVPRAKFTLPFTGRLPAGQGMDITDYDTVKADHQWDSATDPAAAPADAAADSSAAPAADSSSSAPATTP